MNVRAFDRVVKSDRFAIIPVREKHHVEAARALCREYCSQIAVDLSSQDIDSEIAALPGAYSPPSGDMFLAIDREGDPFGCIAFKPLQENDTCEIKRLFVRASKRGRGAGKALLERALDEASALGYSVAYLDTVPTMTAAIAVYESLGFERTSAYWHNPIADIIFFRKTLARF